MNEPGEKAGGIIAALRSIVDGGLAIVENRLELFAVELRTEKCRLLEALIWAAAVVVFGIMTLTLFTLAIVVVLWSEARIAALFAVSAVYLLVTLLAWRGLHRRLHGFHTFTDTLNEIKKDRECLRSGN